MHEGDMLRHVRQRLQGIGESIDDTLRQVPGVGRFVPGRYPPVDVYETPDSVVVRAEVPGVARENLEVRVRPRSLNLNGRAAPGRYEAYSAVSRESGEGEFKREVPLRTEVDDEAEASAVLENGVLTVRLKKARTEQGKPINVEMR